MTEQIEMTNTSSWQGPVGEDEDKEYVPEGGHSLSYRLEQIAKKEFESWKNFSLEAFLDANCTEIAVGIGVGVLSFFTLGQMDAIVSLVSGGGGIRGGGGIIATAISVGQLPMTLAGAAIKVSFLLISSFIIPYVEEFLFRGLLHEALEGDLGNAFTKGLKVLANAFVFTLCHIPVLLPGVNALILLQIFFLGIALAAIRTYTESRVASTAAHATYNGLIFSSLLALA